MTPRDMNAKDKIDVLMHVHSAQLNEVKHFREREYQIFSWTSSMLLALIGALLVFQPSQGIIWSNYGNAGKVVASLAVVIFVFYSINWQYRNLRILDGSARVVVHISRLLHLHDKGYFDSSEDTAIYPDRWLEWGTPSRQITVKLYRLFFGANYISATGLLGVLTVAMIWVA